MGITLLKPNQTWTPVRILHRAEFGSSPDTPAVSAKDWSVLPMQDVGQRKHGFELLSMERCCLPYVGRARFKLEFGLFEDGLISASAGSVSSLRAGATWNPSQEQLDIQDLRGHEIRIQISPDGGTTWQTAWWGTCEYQEDMGYPGAQIPAGTRIYHCVDGLQRTNRWQVNSHGYTNAYDATLSLTAARGPMSYNTPDEADAIYSKNRSNSTFKAANGSTLYYHTALGRGDDFWTAQQAAEHALNIARPAGEPEFKFATTESLLAGSFTWQVREGDSAMDVLANICRRERGRGNVYVDWTEASATGPLTVSLVVRPQLIVDVSTTDPATNVTTTLPGADTSGTTCNPDLIGDHRIVRESFKLGDPFQHRFDYLETLGEQIEVAATLSYVDGQTGTDGKWEGLSLVRGWSDAEATAFRALTGATIQRRNVFRFKPVFQLHALRPNWTMQTGDGDGGAQFAAQRLDYRCNDLGLIVSPATSDAQDTSPASVQLLSDLPMFERYDYSSTAPALYDAADTVNPTDRRKMMILIRTGSNSYLAADQTGLHATVAADHDHLWLMHSDDAEAGTRFLSTTSDSTLAAGYNYCALVISCGLRLPHRMRYASGDPAGRKRGYLVHDNFHLWLAPPGTIWELDTTVGNPATGYGAKRQACNASSTAPGTLRDDRAALGIIHALTWAWYGTDTDRRSSAWSLRCCGLLPTFSAVQEITPDPQAKDAADIAYPTLGQLVNTLGANGEYHLINTPITRIAYDAKTGVTSWSTEWSELETER